MKKATEKETLLRKVFTERKSHIRTPAQSSPRCPRAHCLIVGQQQLHRTEQHVHRLKILHDTEDTEMEINLCLV